jgi:hypothetical protein
LTSKDFPTIAAQSVSIGTRLSMTQLLSPSFSPMDLLFLYRPDVMVGVCPFFKIA